MFSFLEKNKFLLLTLATLGFKFICFLLTKIIIRIFVALFFREKRFKWFNDGNQWAVITGATDGIGYEMSQQLAFKGYNLMLIGRNENKLEQTKLKILQNISICAQEKNKLNKNVKTMSSIQIRTMVSDFSTSIDYSSIEHFVQSNLHDIFILVNNVGTSLTIPQRFVEECPISHEEIIHVNIIAATKMMELILSSMINRKRGLVINVASLGAKHSCPLMSVYTASKVNRWPFSRSIINVRFCPVDRHMSAHCPIVWPKSIETMDWRSWHCIRGECPQR